MTHGCYSELEIRNHFCKLIMVHMCFSAQTNLFASVQQIMWPQVILTVGIRHAKSRSWAEWNWPGVPYKWNRYFISYTKKHVIVLLKTYQRECVKSFSHSCCDALSVFLFFSFLNFNIHRLLRMGVVGALLTTKAPNTFNYTFAFNDVFS